MVVAVVLVSGCLQGEEPMDENTQTDTTLQTPNFNAIAVIETNKGTIKFELFEQRAPETTANFIKLAESGFYTGLKFHRYVPGFVIQGGDPRGDGTGGSDETVNLEIHPDLTHMKGAVAMARSNDPNSAMSSSRVSLSICALTAMAVTKLKKRIVSKILLFIDAAYSLDPLRTLRKETF